MTSYKNLAGNVGICSYEIGDDKIRIKFHTGSKKSVVFDQDNTTESHLQRMKHLAQQGYGLNDYIKVNQLD